MKHLTLESAIWQFIQVLNEQGKNKITVNAYSNDLQQPLSFFGADCELSRITLAWVGKFLKSDALLIKANGQERAPHSVARSLRVFRMFLLCSLEQGWIETLPLPKAVSLGRRSKAKLSADVAC